MMHIISYMTQRHLLLKIPVLFGSTYFSFYIPGGVVYYHGSTAVLPLCAQYFIPIITILPNYVHSLCVCYYSPVFLNILSKKKSFKKSHER